MKHIRGAILWNPSHMCLNTRFRTNSRWYCMESVTAHILNIGFTCALVSWACVVVYRDMCPSNPRCCNRPNHSFWSILVVLVPFCVALSIAVSVAVTVAVGVAACCSWCCSVLQSVLQRVAVGVAVCCIRCCSVLQSVLQRVAVGVAACCKHYVFPREYVTRE